MYRIYILYDFDWDLQVHFTYLIWVIIYSYPEKKALLFEFQESGDEYIVRFLALLVHSVGASESKYYIASQTERSW